MQFIIWQYAICSVSCVSSLLLAGCVQFVRWKIAGNDIAGWLTECVDCCISALKKISIWTQMISLMPYERNLSVTGASDADAGSWHAAADVVTSDVTERHCAEISDFKMWSCVSVSSICDSWFCTNRVNSIVVDYVSRNVFAILCIERCSCDPLYILVLIIMCMFLGKISYSISYLGVKSHWWHLGCSLSVFVYLFVV